ncbi:MAG: 3-methyl-2-oxobutanoate dehydrogenase subunit VorB [Oscillospiraceae bacterium]|nr:3-methyl-2-oxobutanoate dehydrogenase subunit VorB [Oscillospiraceae bacterium]
MLERNLMKGNEALAEAAIRAGCKCFFGYPITPQTEISAYLAKRFKQAGGVFLQAESEIAAINMVLGAASTGVRAMTSSSSPGISLKSEGISYIAGSDLPCVIINVQRGGPGLGGIQPSQADYWQATRALGHGDFHLLVYAPCSVQEMVDTVTKAFDMADKFRMPAMILADGLLGQMMEPVSFPEPKTDFPEKPWAANGHGNKREHNIINSLFLQPDVLEKSVKDRFERYEEIKANHAEAELYMTEDADIVLTAYGATARVAKSAVNMAREQGIKAGLIRPITLWPFPVKQINEGSKNAKSILCVEMSMGQMIDDVKLAINCSKPVEFFGRTGGVIPTPAEVLEEIKKYTNGGAK